MIKVSLERALELAAMNNEVYMAVGLSEETPIGEFMMGDFYFAPEPEKKEPEPPKPKKAPKKIDHGKIIACHRAGWSFSKIADEIGCSEQTVRNHIEKEKL